jgi:hypothetical protein
VKLLHVPPSRNATEAVADDVDARGGMDLVDEPLELRRDAPHARTGRVRERGYVHPRVLFQASPHRAEDAGRRKKTVDEYDDVLAGAGLGQDGREIQREEESFANRCEGLGVEHLCEPLPLALPALGKGLGQAVESQVHASPWKEAQFMRRVSPRV